MEFRHQRLTNGLDVIAECNPAAHATALAFCVKTGARDETDELSGVSHFLEHMMFKGTSRRTAAEINRELDEIGSHANAFTGEEQTVYYATVLPEYVERAIDLLADMIRPALNAEDFELEKQVVLEEIYRSEDQPPFGAHEKCMAAHFGSHPLGRCVLGTVESVGGLTPAAMRSYWQRRYCPGNMILAAAGKVDFPALVKLAERFCGQWEAGEASRDTSPTAPHCGFQVLQKESSVQQYAVQIAHGPAADDDDRYACRVLATVLGDDVGSRLFWELIDTGRAEYAGMGTAEFEKAGAVITHVYSAPEQAADNLQRILDVQLTVQRDGVTAEELTQAQNKIASQIVLQSERSANRLFALAGNWIQLGCYRTVHEEVERYRAVDRGRISAVLERFPLTENTTVVIGPLADVAMPQARTAASA